MRTSDLAEILRNRYHNAAERQVVLSVQLFGIEFAEQLRGQSIKEILAMADLPKSYHIEVRTGMRLSEFVELKK